MSLSSEAVTSDAVIDSVLGPRWELPAIGSLVSGRFRLESPLGEGGMSSVFVARDARLGRDVAIKLLSPRLAHSREIVTRFVNEARMLARLDSAHIVRVLDAGVTSEASDPNHRVLPYMVLELLNGEDLRGVCERGPVADFRQALDWMLQACEGLAVAHAEGVIYRDLKPENLFLSRRPDGVDVIKLLDFGVARSLALQSSLTQSGEGVGSPAYMSPEQLNDASTVDERSDIWSLGVVLYELLAGTLPFQADTTFELCAEIRAGHRARLSRYRNDLPRGLAAVVYRCLELDPNDRFANISELADALSVYRPNDLSLRIQRRLAERETGERPSGERVMNVQAPAEPAFDEDRMAFGATRHGGRARRIVSHAVGWVALTLMVFFLGYTFAPSPLPSTEELKAKARESVERVSAHASLAARQVWPGASDKPAK